MELLVSLAPRTMPTRAMVMDRLDVITHRFLVYNRAVFSVRIELMEMVHVCVMMVLMELRVSCVLNLIGLELTALKVNTSTISIEMLYNSASWHQVSGYQDVLISRSAKGYLN